LRRLALHFGLFAATCATTFHAGGGLADWRTGAIFAATLMGILLTHEMGHYVAARLHHIDASLPYFIPVPFIGMGTLGAVIRMKAPIQRRDALIDVGAAGPLAGLVVAIPLLCWGLAVSPVKTLAIDPNAPALIEGNSILYILLKLLIKGQYLPGAGGVDVHLGPMAMAAWVGILVTFINLMPIGQLDGGHVAFAFFGDRHEGQSRWLHRGLLGVGGGVLGAMAIEAIRAGRAGGDAFAYGIQGALPWFIWAALLLGMRKLQGGIYHPPVGVEPLSPSRRALFWAVAIVFLLLFTPIPMRAAL
jgi:membrane-associated protease RseP (regulator of RpoE activity)